MSLVYLAYSVAWFIASCCNWRDLLRVQVLKFALTNYLLFTMPSLSTNPLYHNWIFDDSFVDAFEKQANFITWPTCHGINHEMGTVFADDHVPVAILQRKLQQGSNKPWLDQKLSFFSPSRILLLFIDHSSWYLQLTTCLTILKT